MSQTPPQFPVVGIGASAGGIEALQQLFAQVPPASGCAYVVILHLSPEHDSQLAAIIQAVTPLPVLSVTEQVRVEPNHIYVVPPSQHLTMVDGELRVSPNTLPEERRAPIDIFFRTLADTHGSLAVCVILSGSGSDGSLGLKRVKEYGGAVFVQNPREAEFAEMPRSAIATDLVDEVLSAADIPARIVAYQASLGSVTIPEELEQRPEEQEQSLRELFSQLRSRTGHDFTNYRRPTLLRRIERRITARKLADLPAYASFLGDHPDEVQSLLKDLLISVTNFFRDKEAFTALEQEVLPRIFAGKQAGDQVRVWVVGCATGEEAYSIAMLCAERTMDVLEAPSVQVFASDIDEAAIARARQGLYSTSDLADVSPERLRRFFTLEDGRYRVQPELRELILFANHNILKDPPFSHIDLVSCRNVLIYLNQTAQERVMQTLHFALNPGGYLFLGTSESTDGASDLFTLVSREHHISQHRVAGTRPLPLPEARPTLRVTPPLVVPLVVESDERARERISGSDLHQRLLEQYAPPSMVVTPGFEIVHVTEQAGRYLQVVGEPTTDLLRLIRPELRGELRLALSQAVQRQATVDISPLPFRVEEHSELVTIRVRPVLRSGDPAQGYLLVLFEAGVATASDVELVVGSDEPATRQLEAEVTRLNLQLRTSSEQYEFQAEELKATNEELQATNEEFRATNEELETSKEELQSLNEELRTVNQELKVKIDEATLHSTNLQNLVNSTDIGTIFLDRGLRIKLFTPAARMLFNLIPADNGRPLSDISHRLREVDVLLDAEQVLGSLQTVEREVRTSDDRAYVLRVLPYRAGVDRIGGVALTFFDITERTRAERARAEQARLLDLSNDAIIVRDVDNRVIYWNRGAAELYGWSREEAIGQDLHTLLQTEFEAPLPQLIATLQERDRMEGEVVQVTRDGRRLTLLCRWALDRDAEGRPASILTSYNDITERKRMEQALRERERDFRAIFEGSSVGKAQVHTATRRFLRVNTALCTITGYSEPELLALSVDDLTHPDDRERDRELFEQMVRGKASYQHEKRYVRKDGALVWVTVTGNVIEAVDGQTVRTIAVIQDITARKRAEEALRESEARLQELYAQEQAARAQAEEASRVKDEFLATVSHELRTPLTALLGYTQLLQRRQRDEAYVARTVEKMVQSAKAQAALIEDLLDVSQIVSGKLRIEPRPIEFIDVIHAALDTVQPALEAKAIQVQVELDPAASAVVGDANRLQQVVWNLLANATKFTPPGGQITVQLAAVGSSAVLRVSDTGQGIRADFLPYVFERFRQGDSSSQRTHGGLGLGLAIVRHLVELHGGTVEATSAGVGEGASFTVRLPRAEVGERTDQARSATHNGAEPDTGQLGLHGLRLLVVDDQPNLLELLAELLASEGATVQVCSTAPEALALVRTWQPDVLVSDIALPEKDGYWLIQQVRRLSSEEGGATPAVALTAYVRMEDRLRVLAAGFEQYVPKPVNATELRNVIRALVSKSVEG